MPSKGWYVNGLDELLEDSIDKMKDYNSQYMRDMRSLFSVEKVFQGIDMNEYSIPDLKKMALDTIHKKGMLDPAHGGKLPILCKDKKVRYYDPEKWSETIARTRSRALQEKGLHNEMAEAGFDLVIVSIGGSGDMCRHWEGKILSISGKTPGYQTVAEAQRIHLFHPNCVHSSSPIVATQDVETGETIIWGRDMDPSDLIRLAMPKGSIPSEALFARSVAGLKTETRKYFVYEKIRDGVDEDELVRLFAEKYGLNEKTARGKVRFYISDLKKSAGLHIVKKNGFLSLADELVTPPKEVIAAVKKAEDAIKRETTTGSAFIKEQIEKYKASGKWKDMTEVGKSVMTEAFARAKTRSVPIRELVLEILKENRKFGGDIKYIKGSDEVLKTFFAEAAKDFPTDWWDDFNAMSKSKIRVHKDVRGYWSVNRGPGVRAGNIALSGNYDNTAVHELGHLFEEYRSTPISEKARRKRLHKVVTDFLEERVGGEDVKWLGPGYDQIEKGWRDKFSTGYIGKYYSDGSTEIFSMGVEALHSGNQWNMDREMDEFIIGILLCL